MDDPVRDATMQTIADRATLLKREAWMGMPRLYRDITYTDVQYVVEAMVQLGYRPLDDTEE